MFFRMNRLCVSDRRKKKFRRYASLCRLRALEHCIEWSCGKDTLVGPRTRIVECDSSRKESRDLRSIFR